MSKPVYNCPHCQREYKSAVWLSKHIAAGDCLNKPNPEELIAAALKGVAPRPPTRPAPVLTPKPYIPMTEQEHTNGIRTLLDQALKQPDAVVSDEDYEDVIIDESEDDDDIVINTGIAMGLFDAVNTAVDVVLTDGQLKPIIEERGDKYEDVIRRIQEKYGISLDGLPELELAVMYSVDVGKAIHAANEHEDLYSDEESLDAPEPPKKKSRRLMR